MSFSPRSLTAACLSLLLACGMTFGLSAPATGEPDDHPVQQLTGHPIKTQLINLGNGDRAELSGGPQQRIRPLLRPDGSRPGLILGDGPGGATLQSTDGRQRPQLLRAGTARQPVAVSDDLVELNLAAIGRDGRPAPGHVSIFDVENGAIESARPLPGAKDTACSSAEWADSSCILVPPGTYSVMAFVSTQPAGEPSTEEGFTAQSVALVGDPELEVTGNRTVTFDARDAKPVRVRTPGHRSDVNAGGAVQFGYTRTAANGTAMRRDLMPNSLLEHTFYLQPTEPVTTGGLDTLTRLRLEEPDIEIHGSGLDLEPEYYPAVWFSDLDSNFPTFDGTKRLRVVDIGRATTADLAGLDLTGSIAVAERTDALSIAEQAAAAAAAGAALVIIHNDGPGDSDDPNGTGVRLPIPTLRLSRADGIALKQQHRVTVRGENASRYLYDLVIKEHDRIPSDLSYRYTASDLSTQVRTLYGQPTKDSTYSESAYQYQPGDEFSLSVMLPFRDGPRTRVEYRIPDPETRWTYAVATPELPYNAMFPHPPVQPMTISDPTITAYTRHQLVAKPIGAAPITAAPAVPIQRAGDQLRVSINAFSDADGNRGRGYSDPSGMKTLLQVRADGKLIAETEHLPSGVVQLPAGKSEVEVAFSTENPQPWAELSTRTESRWTFPSDTTAGNKVIDAPIILADYDVGVDVHNRLHLMPGRPASFDLRLTGQQGADPASIEKVIMDVSYDDGGTWQPTTVHSHGVGYRVTLPPGKGYVSLRLRATDADGASLEQTTIRAFAIG